MTNPISQAAVDAACDAYHRPKRMITNTAVGSHYDRMTAALEAAMPHIRAAIASEIRELEYTRDQVNLLIRAGESMDFVNGHSQGIFSAARIAEKGTEQ